MNPGPMFGVGIDRLGQRGQPVTNAERSMCGIAGVLNLEEQEPVDRARLAAANDTMVHRGPDESGIRVDRDIGLAMRRLNIIDVAHGHQPMGNEDGTVQLVYNGEIYNHGTLRAELQACGHRFRTTCDTEVVVHAYEQWGAEGCLRRFRGMFAFALWDGRSRTLFLARDRMGIKPLYHAEWKGRLYFASEIRPLLACSGMDRRVETEALEEYLEVGFVTCPRTLFKGVKKLPPAHYLLAGPGGITVRRYWALTYAPVAPPDKREAVEGFRAKLEECVHMSMMSEVPLGALLSGGIDSATTVALMLGRSQHPVTTVCVGFSARAYDESAMAAETAAALGTLHHTVTFTRDTMEEFPRALSCREEPVDHPIFMAGFKLFEACRQTGLTVVLTGEGSDELLGGYQWHRHDALLRPLLALPPAARRAFSRILSVRYDGDARLRFSRLLERGPAPAAERYITLMGVDPLRQRGSLLSRQLRESPSSVAASWEALADEAGDASDLHRMLWLESRTRMVDWINQNVDRMSMAHSVEARPPFLDHELWEYCAALPASWKLHGPYPLRTEKHLLRQATKGLIPGKVRRRKKRGLSVPFTGWLARPRLPAWAEEALDPRVIAAAGMFDADAVIRLREQVQRGMPGTGRLFMGILAAQVWWKLFIDAPAEKVGRV